MSRLWSAIVGRMLTAASMGILAVGCQDESLPVAPQAAAARVSGAALPRQGRRLGRPRDLARQDPQAIAGRPRTPGGIDREEPGLAGGDHRDLTAGAGHARAPDPGDDEPTGDHYPRDREFM